MEQLIITLLLFVSFSSCIINEDELLTENLFFGCYDQSSFGVPDGAEIDGLPQSCRSIIFEESFTDNSNDWYTSNSSEAAFAVSNSSYIASTEDVNFYVRSPLRSIDRSNYEVQVQASFGSGAQSSFGISFAATDGIAGQLYHFSIDQSGLYKVGLVENGQGGPDVRGPLASFAISQTGSNELLIRHFDGTFYFFINEVFITQLELPLGYGNEIGLRVGANSVVEVRSYDVFSYEGL